jgi:hypothetical protein
VLIINRDYCFVDIGLMATVYNKANCICGSNKELIIILTENSTQEQERLEVCNIFLHILLIKILRLNQNVNA